MKAEELRTLAADHGAIRADVWRVSSALESAAVEIERLRADAARYRWLRTAGAWESECGIELLSADPEKFDAAVDEAMKGTT